MKENREQKLIKYLRSLIFRSLLVIVLFLVAAIVSKISPTYKDKIVSNVYEKNLSFTKIKKTYNKYLGGVFPLNKKISNDLTVFLTTDSSISGLTINIIS